MASARKGPRTYYRCARCHALVPTKYDVCGACGRDRFKRENTHANFSGDALVRELKDRFPGSYEI